MMKIIDSNIIIYSALDEFQYLREFLIDSNNYVSQFSQLEVLGYSSLKGNQKLYFESIFFSLNIIPISESVILKAIELRQKRKMTAGDAIIAATALLQNLEIITRNTADFEWIENIMLKNPII